MRCIHPRLGLVLVLGVWGALLAPLAARGADSPGAASEEQQDGRVDLSNGGWRLWLDVDAPWKKDQLYLPDEVDLSRLPSNAPTGGWSVLSGSAGIAVSLPGTVEEHYWARTLHPDATPTQVVEHNGSYDGVSWWYCPFAGPSLADGERCLIHFRATRLRTEVYVNQKLVGYNLISELPFTVDATSAVHRGAGNVLALRITNPGGELAWDDTGLISWGNYRIPMSHGFGGVDGGVQMLVRGSVYVSDLAVFNTPNPGTVTLSAELTAGRAYRGPVAFAVRRGSQTVLRAAGDVDIPAGAARTVTTTVAIPSAELWDINHPSLYLAEAKVPGVAHSDAQTPFGCRWFAPVGIGSDAKLLLNGRRIVVRSSISWGFWAPNGMFPDQPAVAREVSAVKALGLNSIQNHRHMPKELVLEGFDQAGLLRYCEAGAGLYSFTTHPWASDPPPKGAVDDSGKGGEPKGFTARYEMFKVLGMVRNFRSHPSVSLWSLQNEISPDLHNPSIFWMIRKVHEIDPSRTVILKSGVTPENQVLMEPYSNHVRSSDGTGFSGWWDQHTAGDSRGEYIDSMYNSPADWEYRTENKKEIVCWGEMATGASPDNHSAVARWYAEGDTADRPRAGYDRMAAETIRDAYQQFDQSYGFSAAFPTPESLFLAAGNKHYFSAARVLENARICDPIDYIVLSGWESTIIDNHSGMTDALRQLKGDPTPLQRAGADQVLVLRPRHYVVARGQPIVCDVHLVNEHKRQGAQSLRVAVTAPGGQKMLDQTSSVDVVGGDTYGQLLKAGYTVVGDAPGIYTVTARLQASGGDPDLLERTERVLVIDPQPAPISQRIAYIDSTGRAAQLLKDSLQVDAAAFDPADGAVGRILLDSDFTNASAWRAGRQWGRVYAAPSDKSLDPALFNDQMEGPAGDVVKLPLANGPATVELFFCDVKHDASRSFDVALNGQTVLKQFCPEKQPGAQGGFGRQFTVQITDGQLTLSVPAEEHGKAIFTAMRVRDASGAVMRRVFREDAFTDAQGKVWQPAELIDYDFTGALAAVLPRLREGARAVLVTGNDQAARAAGSALAAAGLVDFDGIITHSGPSWFGAWYFGRQHWLLNGLPADCVWDWQYQVDCGEADGMLLSGHNLEGVVAFSKDHSPRIGLGVASIPVGKGQIVVLCLPGLTHSLVARDDGYHGFHPVAARRLLFNALN